MKNFGRYSKKATMKVGGLLLVMATTLGNTAAAFPDDVAGVKYWRLASEQYMNASAYALIVDNAARNASQQCGEPVYINWHLRNDVHVAAANTHMSHFGDSGETSTHDATHGFRERMERAGKNIASKWTAQYDCLTLQNRMANGQHDLGDPEFTPALDDMAHLYGHEPVKAHQWLWSYNYVGPTDSEYKSKLAPNSNEARRLGSDIDPAQPKQSAERKAAAEPVQRGETTLR